MKNPLLIPLTAMGLGIVTQRYMPFSLIELLCTVVALLCMLVVAVLFGTRRATLFAGFTAVTFLGAVLALRRAPAPPPELNVEWGATAILEGCVVNPPVLSGVREQFLLELIPGARAKVTVWLKDQQQPPPLSYGQRVEVTSRVRRPRNFQNPGAFDFAGYLARQDVYWTASATGPESVRVLPGECGSPWLAHLYSIRAAALLRIDTLYGAGNYTSGLMRALLLGDTAHVDKSWTDDFRRTGTYHALVVSGLHVSLVAGALLFLWRVVGLPRGAGLILAALSGWFYVMLCGWQAPALRAAAGFTLFSVARLVYRKGRLLNLLAAVAIAFLIYDPSQVFDPSFQLSFLSVAAIGAIATPLLDRIDGLEVDLPNTARDAHLAPRIAQFRVELRLVAQTFSLWTRLRESLCLFLLGLMLRGAIFIYGMAIISISVQVALILPMVTYFHRASLTGVSANLIVVPLLSAAVPIGLFALLGPWVLPANLAGLLLDLSRRAVESHVAWESSRRIPDPSVWISAVFMLVLLAVLLLPRHRKIAVSALAVCAVFICWPTSTSASSGILELTAIDVGQGDSILLGLPDGKWMLIDAGGIPVFRGRPKPKLDIGEDVVTPYLLRRGITKLDAVVCTHAHEDHIGGLQAIVDNFHPRHVWGGANVKPAGPFLCAGKCSYGGAEIEALAPRPGYQPGRLPRNNDSLVLRITHGRHVFLLTGDMERQVEAELVERQMLGRVDVLKVAHHGSKSSSTEGFLKATRPAIAVISVGAANLYRHPHPEVVERLQAGHAAVFRTDTDGLITVRSDGRRLNAETFRWTPPVVVSADSSPLY